MFTPEWITAYAAIVFLVAGIVGIFVRTETRLARIETLLNTLPCQDYRKKIQEDQVVSCPGKQILD